MKTYMSKRVYGRLFLILLLADGLFHLTLKHWETHGCIVSTVATDALVLKHQAISIHNAD